MSLGACLLVAATSVAASPAAAQCDTQGDAPALRRRAAELYEAGSYDVADACVSAALVRVTKELELLAAQAQALRTFREERQRVPAVAPTGRLHAARSAPTFERGHTYAVL